MSYFSVWLMAGCTASIIPLVSRDGELLPWLLVNELSTVGCGTPNRHPVYTPKKMKYSFFSLERICPSKSLQTTSWLKYWRKHPFVVLQFQPRMTNICCVCNSRSQTKQNVISICHLKCSYALCAAANSYMIKIHI